MSGGPNNFPALSSNSRGFTWSNLWTTAAPSILLGSPWNYAQFVSLVVSFCLHYFSALSEYYSGKRTNWNLPSVSGGLTCNDLWTNAAPSILLGSPWNYAQNVRLIVSFRLHYFSALSEQHSGKRTNSKFRSMSGGGTSNLCFVYRGQTKHYVHNVFCAEDKKTLRLRCCMCRGFTNITFTVFLCRGHKKTLRLLCRGQTTNPFIVFFCAGDPTKT